MGGVVCRSTWGQHEELEMLYVVMHLPTPSSEACDSFPKHLDLAMGSNKRTEGVEK